MEEEEIALGQLEVEKREREEVEKGTIRQSGWKEENWRDGRQLRIEGVEEAWWKIQMVEKGIALGQLEVKKETIRESGWKGEVEDNQREKRTIEEGEEMEEN